MAYRPPNPNTKYGRKRMRDEAQYKYDTGTPEYRGEIDTIKGWVWFVVMLIALVVFGIIWAVSGPEAALKWAK